MRCVFVLDILNGAVVRGVRGERSRYEPVEGQSVVVNSSDPLEVLCQVAPKEVYVADLDRITGSGDNLAVIEEIGSQVPTMADIGVSGIGEVDLLERAVLVLGTETGSMELFDGASARGEVVVSVDMMGHRVITGDEELKVSPTELVMALNDLDLAGVILLELDRVGTSEGIDETFLEEMVSLCDHPLILGGGVKGPEDLDLLEEIGIDKALVATAVHNGKIPLETLRR